MRLPGVEWRLNIVSMCAAEQCDQQPADQPFHLLRQVLVRPDAMEREPKWLAHEQGLVDGRIS